MADTPSTPGSSSTVLIHGAFAAGSWWDLVVPHFSTKYHVLALIYPATARACVATGFSVQNAVGLVARLIRHEARTSQAHSRTQSRCSSSQSARIRASRPGAIGLCVRFRINSPDSPDAASPTGGMGNAA
ncbi:hypothetical protein BJX99DRAFT_264540 [Aspergillus californicus]